MPKELNTLAVTMALEKRVSATVAFGRIFTADRYQIT